MEGVCKWVKTYGGTFSTVVKDSTVAYSGSSCVRITAGWLAGELYWAVTAVRWFGGSPCRRRSVRFRFRFVAGPADSFDFRPYLYVRDGTYEYYWMLRYDNVTARWYCQNAAGGWTLLLQMGAGYGAGVWVEVEFEGDIGKRVWRRASVNGVELGVKDVPIYKFASSDPPSEALLFDLSNTGAAPFVGWGCVTYVDDVLVMEI